MCAARALRLVSETGTICRVELFFRSHGLAKARPSRSRGPDQHSRQLKDSKEMFEKTIEMDKQSESLRSEKQDEVDLGKVDKKLDRGSYDRRA